MLPVFMLTTMKLIQKITPSHPKAHVVVPPAVQTQMMMEKKMLKLPENNKIQNKGIHHNVDGNSQQSHVLSQNDPGKVCWNVTATGLEQRVSVSSITQQQVSDHSIININTNTRRAPTPSKYGLFLEDSLFKKFWKFMKAQMKVCINKKLFQNIKFYDSQNNIQNVVGYVFQDIGMDGSSIREN